ncbi:MAG TPA: hypothetical protein VI456_07715 [Polyangia bacterium]
MAWTPGPLLKACAFASLTVWGVALFLPAYVTPLDNDPKHLSSMLGLETLPIGWAGVEEGKWGWWANPLWLAGLISLFRGRRPQLLPATTAGVLAASALFAVHIDYGDDHGVNGDSTPGAGAWFWAAAIAVVFVTSLATSLARGVAMLRAKPASTASL